MLRLRYWCLENIVSKPEVTYYNSPLLHSLPTLSQTGFCALVLNNTYTEVSNTHHILDYRMRDKEIINNN